MEQGRPSSKGIIANQSDAKETHSIVKRNVSRPSKRSKPGDRAYRPSKIKPAPLKMGAESTAHGKTGLNTGTRASSGLNASKYGQDAASFNSPRGPRHDNASRRGSKPKQFPPKDPTPKKQHTLAPSALEDMTTLVNALPSLIGEDPSNSENELEGSKLHVQNGLASSSIASTTPPLLGTSSDLTVPPPEPGMPTKSKPSVLTRETSIAREPQSTATAHCPQPHPTLSPTPSNVDIHYASTSAQELSFMQPDVPDRKLLIILDLNGTLIARRAAGITAFAPRPGLCKFLDYIFSRHAVMVWTSMMPRTTAAITPKVFAPEQHGRLIGVWSRDTLGLSKKSYHQRVQVYKKLTRVWADAQVAAKCAAQGLSDGVGQWNTVLLDDSRDKAIFEPYNLASVPELSMGAVLAQERAAEAGNEQALPLRKLQRYLQYCSRVTDVSAFIRRYPFESCELVWDRNRVEQAAQKGLETQEGQENQS